MRILLFILFSVFSVVASAQSPEPQDLLIVPGEAKLAPPSATPLTKDPNDANEEQLNVVYNSREEGSVVTETNKEAILKRLREEIVPLTSDEVYLPEAPADEIGFEKLSALSEQDIQIFLSKKKSFMQRFAKTLRFFKIKPKFINKALIEINKQFYDSTRLIAKSNAIGGSVMFSLSGGLAVPSKVSNFLKDRVLGKFIPESGGFYYLLGIGVGITRVTDEATQKTSWVLESYVDTESLKKSISGIVEISAAGTYGVIYEHREGDFRIQKLETTYGGLTGIFKKGPTQFGWSATSGLSFPPGIGMFLVFTDKTTRRYIVRINLSKYVIDPIAKLISNFKSRTSVKLRCSAILRN